MKFRYSISACLMLTVVFAVLTLVFNSFQPQYDDHVRMSREEVIALLERIRTMEHAVLFVELAPISMKYSRDQFKKTARTVEEVTSNSTVYFAIVDFTPLSSDAYAPFSTWEGWDALATNEVNPIQGRGEMFWISKGKILDSTPSIDFRTADAVVAKTLAIFGLRAR